MRRHGLFLFRFHAPHAGRIVYLATRSPACAQAGRKGRHILFRYGRSEALGILWIERKLGARPAIQADGYFSCGRFSKRLGPTIVLGYSKWSSARLLSA